MSINFKTPKRGDVFLSKDETIFTIVNIDGERLDFHYELSPMSELLVQDAVVASGVRTQMGVWRETVVPLLDFFLVNVGDIPFQLLQLSEEIDEDKEIRHKLLKILTIPIWACSLTPGIEEVFTITPFGWAISEEFYEFGARMGFTSPMLESLDAEALPKLQLFNHLLTQTVNYRNGGRTPHDILKDKFKE